MRLKEDSDSWKARGIKHRDFRHSHDGPEVIEGKKIQKKTRAKIDHKHVWVEVDYLSFYFTATTHYRCTICEATKFKRNVATLRKYRATPFRKGPRIRGKPVSRRQYRF